MADNRSVVKKASIRGLFRRVNRQKSKFELSSSESSEASEASSVTSSSSSGRAHSPESFYEDKPDSSPTIKFKVASPPLSPPEDLCLSSPHTQWPAELQDKRPGSYMFDAAPTLVQTPWERQRLRHSAPQIPPRHSAIYHYRCPANKLPRSIMNRIVDTLRNSYRNEDSLAVQNFRNDLCALQRTSKRWYRIVHPHLYDDVWLPSNERPRGRRLSLARYTSALSNFQRTLEETPFLAESIRHLRVPYSLSNEIQDQSSAQSLQHSDETLQIIADIITLCPNLELFTGFWGPDCDGHIAIWDALATRPMLKSHCWAMDPSWAWNTRIMPGYHSKWQRLETLAISDTTLGTGTLFGILWFLPSLKHLLLRNLSGTGIHKGTLMMLPALESLRLENLPGITDEGLEKMISPKISPSLKRLTLVDMDVQKLETVRMLLSCLTYLKRFALIQDSPLEILGGGSGEKRDSGVEFLMGSRTLQELSWSTKDPEEVIAVIAASIAAGMFGALRKVKTPRDDKVVIQSLSHSNARAAVAARSPGVEERTMAQVVGSYLEDNKTVASPQIEVSRDPIGFGTASLVREFGSAIVPVMRGMYDQMLDFHTLF